MKLKWYLFFLTILTVSIVLYNYVEKKADSPIKIGVLMIGDSRLEKFSGLKKGMTDLGYDDKDIKFLFKNAHDRKENLINDIDSLLKKNPDVIVTLGGIETLDLQARLENSKQNIPVVFAGVAAPKEIGLIKDYKSPGGQFTGINNYHTSISGKRMEIFHDLVPSIQRFHVLYDEEIETSRLSLEKTREAAGELSIMIIPGNVGEPDFFQKIETNLRKGDAIIILPGFRIESLTNEIVQLSKKYGLPVMGLYEQEVKEGYLASYGASFYDQGYQSARYVSLIIQGNSPRDIPVELPDSIRFLVNRQVQEELGINLNKNLLYIADLIDGDGKEENSE
ncbi:ABC transporter substrate-binding protein [Bacillus sp. V33-4]|uniref:ABC transporter substrate-binding protein n=1 Tax=Bacillus sp. V33-4 TaxID=2054169 RepID=UPI000C774A00|nr:ABC transporter substrate-binding protein [Bacillus sp. V33-4]PLR83662.1 hypothetical protein CVD23_13580 [Bacillus sp. V33-4]